jgi:hypothetical protein
MIRTRRGSFRGSAGQLEDVREREGEEKATDVDFLSVVGDFDGRRRAGEGDVGDGLYKEVVSLGRRGEKRATYHSCRGGSGCP